MNLHFFTLWVIKRPLDQAKLRDQLGLMKLLGFDGALFHPAYVTIDGIECCWCWGPDWSATLPIPLTEGEHRITVKLVPSTFNLYGPHHHIDGDLHIVSPVPYAYRRNFADRWDAPECTRVDRRHVKRFGIG